MSLEVWVGGVGVAVFTIVFIAGMLIFTNFDTET